MVEFNPRDALPSDIDAVCLFVSFEDRCTRIAQELAACHFGGRVIAFYCEDTSVSAVESNRAIVQELFPETCEWVPVNYRNSLAMVVKARDLQLPESLLIDLSCFHRENLFSFLWATQMGRDFKPSITFGYVSPEGYGSWLSAEYEKARNILGYSGGDELKQNRHLICCVGFESERVIKVIEALEPSSVTIAVGTTPTRDEFLRRNEAAVRQVVGSSNYEIQEINVVDPAAAQNDLMRIVESAPLSASIHCAPFNTKLSCIALFSVWLQRNDIRIWNVQPQTYNALYSHGSHPARYFDADW